jgi:hypothetical protein
VDDTVKQSNDYLTVSNNVSTQHSLSVTDSPDIKFLII